MKCKDCFFYEGVCEDDTFDFCRRYPPVTFWNMVKMDTEAEWPVVNGENDWCGEFKLREGFEHEQSDQREKH